MVVLRSLVWVVALALLVSALTPCARTDDANVHELVTERSHEGCHEHLEDHAVPRFLMIAVCPCGCADRSAPSPLVSSQGHLVPANEVELASGRAAEITLPAGAQRIPARLLRAVDHVPKRA